MSSSKESKHLAADLLEGAKQIADAGDRWFLSLARGLGKTVRNAQGGAELVAESAVAAAKTTGRVANRILAAKKGSKGAERPLPSRVVADAPAEVPPDQAPRDAEAIAKSLEDLLASEKATGGEMSPALRGLLDVLQKMQQGAGGPAAPVEGVEPVAAVVSEEEPTPVPGEIAAVQAAEPAPFAVEPWEADLRAWEKEGKPLEAAETVGAASEETPGASAADAPIDTP